MKRVFLVSIYFLLAAFLAGCATTSTVSMPQLKKAVAIGGRRYIFAESLAQAYNLDYHWDPIAKKLTLARADKEASLMVGSSLVLLNQKMDIMGAEARFYRGEVVIPQSFAQRTLAPFFKEELIRKRAVAVGAGLPIRNVILDPGHGGKDPGAIGKGGLQEKDVVLDIARRLKRKLGSMGINVTLTRDSDKFISLDQRSRIANSKDADFFISIHANASRSRWVNGVEVFYLTDSIDDESRSLSAAKKYDLGLEEAYSGEHTPAILWSLRFKNNRRSSGDLAEFICCSLSRSLSQRNRGTKQARFYVLKSNLPAILIEVGFISNPSEEKRLRSPSYRDKITQAICEGIVQYNRNLTEKSTARY